MMMRMTLRSLDTRLSLHAKYCAMGETSFAMLFRQIRGRQSLGIVGVLNASFELLQDLGHHT